MAIGCKNPAKKLAGVVAAVVCGYLLDMEFLMQPHFAGAIIYRHRSGTLVSRMRRAIEFELDRQGLNLESVPLRLWTSFFSRRGC